MAHNIPKIEYGGFVPTVIQFVYPPEDDGPEELEPKGRITTSLSGRRQVAVDYIEATRKLKFSLLTESARTALETFFRTHAHLGKSFKYYEDIASATYTTYEMVGKLISKRVAIAGENTFFYSTELTFRRVVGEEDADCMTSDINNGVASPANIVGLVLDSTQIRAAKVFFNIHRKTDSNEIVANGWLTALYSDTSGWAITTDGTYDEFSGLSHGVTFSITGGGQVQYISDTLAGANYTGTIEFKDLTVC